MPKAARFLIAAVAALLAVAAVAWYVRHEEGDGRVVRVSGNIETTDAEVSFKIGGRVVQRLVDEGEWVTKGQTVAILDTSDLQCDVTMREADLKAAEEALAELHAGSRIEDKAAALAAKQRADYYLQELVAGSRAQQIEAAKADAKAAEVDSQRLRTEFVRASQLLESRVIAREQYDFAKAAYDSSVERLRRAKEQLSLLEEGTRQQQIDQAKAALDEATAKYDLVMAGPRKETIAQAAAKVQQARAALNLANVRLGYATIVSPIEGVVLSKNIEPGEYVAPGTPVVTVGDIKHVWLRAYITALEFDRVKFGQKALVTIDSRPSKPYEGRVSFISQQAEFTPKTVQTTKERVKLVYRIKIDILNDDMELKPGMPADADILVSQK